MIIDAEFQEIEQTLGANFGVLTRGEKGDKGDKGDKGEDANTDQTYSPTSQNAQSGIAVAEAVRTKANLQLKELDITEYMAMSNLLIGTHIYELKTLNVLPEGTYEMVFTNGSIIITAPNEAFKVGGKYLITAHMDNDMDWVFDVVAEVIDLDDKVNIKDIDQSFNAESENPQSGIAVAEAVEWIVLADNTLDETTGNVRVVSVELDKEKVNACREFMFELDFTNDVELKSSNIQVSLITPYWHSVLAYILQQSSTYAVGKKLNAAAFSVRDNECMYSIYRDLFSSVEFNSRIPTYTAISYNYNENADVIKLRVAFNEGNTFPVGTHIRLVGRR